MTGLESSQFFVQYFLTRGEGKISYMSCKINWKSLILCKHCINRVQCRTKETSLMMSNFELSTGVPQRLNVGDPHLSQYYGATCRQGSSPDPLLKCCEGSEYFHLHSQNSSWKKSVYRVQPTRGKGKKMEMDVGMSTQWINVVDSL